MSDIFEHTNRKGHHFRILIGNASTPDGSNYWAFSFDVTEVASQQKHRYRAAFKKEEFPTRDEANRFIFGEPLKFLKQAFLDHYENGSHPLLAPEMQDGWVVYQ